MPSTTVGLVYSIATGRIRQIIIPDADAELTGFVLGQGQSISIISTSPYTGQTLAQLQATLSATIGITPSNDRYVVVDASNNVLSAVIADPACGDGTSIVGASFIPHQLAQPGDLLLGGTTLFPKNPPKPYVVGKGNNYFPLSRKNNDAVLT